MPKGIRFSGVHPVKLVVMVARIDHIVENGIEKRWCGQCKLYKQCDTKFGKSSQTWDGLRSTCKDCLKDYNSSHKKERHVYNAEYWKRTKDKQSVKHKKWLQENKEHWKQYCKKYRVLHGKAIDKKQWQQRKNNLEYRTKHNDYVREWCKKQRLENPQYKLKQNISRRIRELLHKKDMRTVEYLGCSMAQLQCHLEKRFDEFMTWENQGRWHIDHKIPVAAFDLNNVVEKNACFHYTNLQPMWDVDNIEKGDKYDPKEKAEHIRNWMDRY